MIGLPQIGVFFKQMIPPDWGYLIILHNARHDSYGNCRYFSWKYCSIPIALLCASNIVQTKWIAIPSRFVLNIVRTIPDLLLAAVFVAIFGIGQMCISTVCSNNMYHW